MLIVFPFPLNCKNLVVRAFLLFKDVMHSLRTGSYCIRYILPGGVSAAGTNYVAVSNHTDWIYVIW